jgi:hypothetical protein
LLFLFVIITRSDVLARLGSCSASRVSGPVRGGLSSMSTTREDTYYEITKNHVILWKNNECLHICFDDVSKKVEIVRKAVSHKRRGSRTDGIFGMFDIDGINYIALIAKSQKTKGYLHSMHQITKIMLVRLPGSTTEPFSSNGHRHNLQCFQKAIAQHSLYFSKSGEYDVTRSAQRNMQMGNVQSWRHCDDRFFWNFNAVQPLMQHGRDGSDWIDKWIVPVTNAWITSSSPLHLNGRTYGVNLISRRSRHNQGTR